jgi:hypothetical protein
MQKGHAETSRAPASNVGCSCAAYQVLETLIDVLAGLGHRQWRRGGCQPFHRGPFALSVAINRGGCSSPFIRRYRRPIHAPVMLRPVDLDQPVTRHVAGAGMGFLATAHLPALAT